MFEIANAGIILSSPDIDVIKRRAVDTILKWVNDDAEKAYHVAIALASLDWQQIINERQRAEIESLMWSYEEFNRRYMQGSAYCDWCNERYNVLYSWPYVPADSRVDRLTGNQVTMYVETCQKLCWKCFRKEAEDVRFDKHLWKCNGCERLIPQKAMIQVGNERVHNLYCLHCVESAAEKQFIICQGCGKKTASSTNELCYACCKVKSPYQWQVSSHLSRAREAGTPATLTLKEWAITVAYFGNKCAYCRNRPFEVLEHFIPINLGGGTTVENCIPACNICNSKKGSKHPEKLPSFFLPENIEIIRWYLDGEKQTVSPYATNDRALVVYGA